MAITYQEQTFTGLNDFIQEGKTKKASLSGKDSTPHYAHPVDQWILRTLNATPVKAVISKAMDAMVSFQFGYELASSVVIDQKSFPDLYEVLAHCSKTLGIPIPHAVTSNAPGLFNAYTAGTDDYAFINISATLCQLYSKEEASFVIGHECGHIAATHMVYHTAVRLLTSVALSRLGFGYLAYILRATAGIPLLAWSRRSEVTADRAGLLCCNDINVAERGLLKLITGFADIERVDIDDYLRRSKNMEDYHQTSEFQALFTSHPQIPKRIEALRLFANSELYYELSGKSVPEGTVLLNRSELDRRTNQMVQP